MIWLLYICISRLVWIQRFFLFNFPATTGNEDVDHIENKTKCIAVFLRSAKFYLTAFLIIYFSLTWQFKIEDYMYMCRCQINIIWYNVSKKHLVNLYSLLVPLCLGVSDVWSERVLCRDYQIQWLSVQVLR